MLSFKRGFLPLALLVSVHVFANTATDPTPNEQNRHWMGKHEKILADLQSRKIDLLFVGDSITDFWAVTGKEIWKEEYGDRAGNAGISGDRTEHVLWRIDNGMTDGLSPATCVLMIGTNNLAHNTDEEISEGVIAVIGKLREKLPDTKLLVLGIFPRGEEADDPDRARIKTINEDLSKTADGEMIHYLDIGQVFLSDDGTLSKDVMWDFLHLTDEGYTRWAEATRETLEKLSE